MFVRFRDTPDRLHVSLVETRRCDGRVKYEHIASFGSVLKPLTVERRLAFWKAVHERMARLANRVSDPGRVLSQIHARIPMVITDEQDALKSEHAASHERFWTDIRDGHQDSIKCYQQLITHAEQQMRAAQAAKATAEEHLAQAKETVERLHKGENVPVAKPLTRDEVLRLTGWTKKDVQHAAVLGAIYELGADKELIKAVVHDDKRERRIARAVLRKARKLAGEEARGKQT
jgi:hypothetical protein